MNIIYLHCHDAGRYLQPYGYAVPTPHLQAFSERATTFRNHHTVGPTCSPSRACLLTGTEAHQCMTGLAHRGFSLTHPKQHLAPYLTSLGYHTVLSGIQHECKDPHTLYDEILSTPDLPYNAKDNGGYFLKQDVAIAQSAADFLHRDHGDQPFFLSCGFCLPHRPFPLESAFNPNTVRPPEPLADTEANRLDWAKYMTAAQGMDRAAGVVLDALRSSGHDRDTIIIFTTDHGPAFPEMKCRLTDFGTQVAMIIDYPNNPARGKVIDNMVSILDIFPTFAELAQFPQPEWLEGKSLLPLFKAAGNGVAPSPLHDAIYAQVNYHATYEPMRSIRTDRYKLIRLLDSDTRPAPPNIDDSPSKDFWLVDAEMKDQVTPPTQLFDLFRDPMERHNLANDPAYANILTELEARLDAHLNEKDDPAMTGKIPAPSGAIITPRNQYKL